MKAGGMPMSRDPKTGKMIPTFAMDGVGKMKAGGMSTKGGMKMKGGGLSTKGGTKMTLAAIKKAAADKGYKLVKIKKNGT